MENAHGSYLTGVITSMIALMGQTKITVLVSCLLLFFLGGKGERGGG